MQKQRLLSAIGRQQAPATAAEQVLPGRREWSSSEKIYQRSRTRPGTAPLARGKKLYARVSVAVESIEAGEAELLADQSLDGGVVHVAASGLGVGFVPREMLVGPAALSHIHTIGLTDPIPPRSIYLFQRKNQPLSVAARHLRQMLLEDVPEDA